MTPTQTQSPNKFQSGRGPNRRSVAVIIALCASLLLFSACRSDCARLCDKQAECANGAEGDLSIAKQAEMCRTMCETMSSDKARSADMEKAFVCTEKSCAEFKSCVTAAETVK